MGYYLDVFWLWVAEKQAAASAWLGGLDRQGWLMLLMVIMLFGFLCMRGYGSRNDY